MPLGIKGLWITWHCKQVFEYMCIYAIFWEEVLICFKGYFAQNMLTSTRTGRDQYGDYISLNAIYMKVFNVFNCSALRILRPKPRCILPCVNTENWAKRTTQMTERYKGPEFW